MAPANIDDTFFVAVLAAADADDANASVPSVATEEPLLTDELTALLSDDIAPFTDEAATIGTSIALPDRTPAVSDAFERTDSIVPVEVPTTADDAD
jgi:hypothetical protein